MGKTDDCQTSKDYGLYAVAVIKRYIMERCRLTILVESRIRWKVYVRFGGEYWETYLGNKTRRRVLSLHNQVVKVVNAHFSNVAIPHQIAMLEQRTRELKALSIEILNLAKQAKEWLQIEDRAPRPVGLCAITRRKWIRMKPRCCFGRRCSNHTINAEPRY